MRYITGCPITPAEQVVFGLGIETHQGEALTMFHGYPSPPIFSWLRGVAAGDIRAFVEEVKILGQ